MYVVDLTVTDEAKNLWEQMPKRESIPRRWHVVAGLQSFFFDFSCDEGVLI